MPPIRRDDPHEAALTRLLDALPGPMRRGYHALRRPGLRWVRVPLAVLLMLAGVLGFLPILGFWMLPIGVLLLAEDLPVLRRPTLRALAAAQTWWDRFRARRTTPRQEPR